MRFPAFVFTAVMLTALFSTNGAMAAARVCGKPVLGELSHASSRMAARRAAIASWRRGAVRLGKPFTNWRLAADKRYRCARLKDGRYACVAFAKPCRYLHRVPRKENRRGWGQQTPRKAPQPQRPQVEGIAPRDI